MLGQLDMAGHPEVGLGLLLGMTVSKATVIAPVDNIALVPLMTADVANLQVGMYLLRSL